MTDKHVFIVGSKGIPANYGGFETFVDKLTENRQSENISYHVACMSDKNDRFTYNNADCFNVATPNLGPARAVYYDLAAIKESFEYISKHPEIEKPILYVLACRIGPFFRHRVRKWHKLGGKVYVNPDGHEWKRAKWNWAIKKYWKFSERLMVKHADLLVCDSKNIEKYIKEDYKRYKPNTTFIAYGTDAEASKLKDDSDQYMAWLKEHGTEKGQYYLVVGRFVPENNYETMIREFMASNTRKKFVIITTPNDKFYGELNQKLEFEKDDRICFAKAVYDQELLKKIRENAYGYLHGHEVGGTNPSLLEALQSTKLNLLLGVGFNREVAEDTAVYWIKDQGSLARLIEKCDSFSENIVNDYGKRAKARMDEMYSWPFIVSEYERLFK